jgi:hypothetical protein
MDWPPDFIALSCRLIALIRTDCHGWTHFARSNRFANFGKGVPHGFFIDWIDPAVCRKWRFRLRLNSLEMAPE